MSDEYTLNVITALRAVSEEVEAITKSRTATAGGTYKYRGIEDVLSALHPLFVKHGILVVPRIEVADTIYRDVPKFNAKGEPTGSRAEYEARIIVHYTIYGPGGPGDKIDASVYSTGTDSSDKCTGKALSYAYKNLMFQLLCIPTAAAEDNEAAVPDLVERTMAAPQGPQMPENWPALAKRLTNLDADVKNNVLARFIALGYFKFDEEKGGRVPAHVFTSGDIDVMDRMITQELQSAYDRAPGPDPVGAGLRSVPGYEPEETPSEGVTFGEVAGLRSVPDPIADGEVIEVVGEQAVALDLLSAVNTSHPQHAIDTMAEALNSDNPQITNPAMWALAEYYDPDEIIWWPLAKPFGYKSLNGLIKKAKEVAALHKLPEPNHVNDIHGLLASELRLVLLRDAADEEPF